MSDMEIKVFLEEANVNKDFFDCKKNNLKCPFCQQKLDYDDLLGSCINEHCEESFDMVGTESLWRKVIDLKQELDRTRKALDVAVDALKEIDKTRSVANHKIGTPDKTLNSGIVFCWTTPDEVHNALEQIIATLENKKTILLTSAKW